MSNRKKLTEEQKRIRREKCRKTCLERYGNPTYNNIEKCRKTKKERYGDENYNNMEKQYETCLEKYGCIYHNQNEEVRDKISKTKSSPECIAEYKKTIMDRYGVDNINLVEEIRQKYTDTLMKNYGVTNPLKNKDIYNKHIETMFKNNSFNKSKEEEMLYEKLVNEYGKDDVFRQYSDDRYPYKCDFYVKSKDLFIEVNIHPTHGTHPFNSEDDKDIELLEKLKKENTDWSNAVIDVWSVRDYNKRMCAIKNNLNYKVIYSIKEI